MSSGQISTVISSISRGVWSPWIYRAVRLALGLVFAAAGALKLADPYGFAEIIARYNMVPHFLVPATALLLPAAELIAGLGLIMDIRFSLEAVTAMLLVFAVVLYYGALQGLEIDCGCFSAGELAEHDSLRSALNRDLLMLAGAAYIYLWRFRNRGQLQRSPWRYGWNLKRESL